MHPLNKEQEKRKKTNKQGLNIVILKFETADTLKISVLSELAHIPYLYFPHVFLVIKNLNPATKTIQFSAQWENGFRGCSHITSAKNRSS